jgi:hypothetical protein
LKYLARSLRRLKRVSIRVYCVRDLRRCRAPRRRSAGLDVALTGSLQPLPDAVARRRYPRHTPRRRSVGPDAAHTGSLHPLPDAVTNTALLAAASPALPPGPLPSAAPGITLLVAAPPAPTPICLPPQPPTGTASRRRCPRRTPRHRPAGPNANFPASSNCRQTPRQDIERKTPLLRRQSPPSSGGVDTPGNPRVRGADSLRREGTSPDLPPLVGGALSEATARAYSPADSRPLSGGFPPAEGAYLKVLNTILTEIDDCLNSRLLCPLISDTENKYFYSNSLHYKSIIGNYSRYRILHSPTDYLHRFLLMQRSCNQFW